MNIPVLVTFVVYLVGMLTIGTLFYRLTENLSDYILGGRRLNSFVAALSAGASDMSGWLLLGLPGALYAGGMSQSWIAIGLVIGAYLNWQFVARRLRSYTAAANDSLTLPDFFEYRFRDKSRLLRIISALVILVFFTIYTSSGLVGGAKLFESSFGLNYYWALAIGALVIVSYTFLGGFMAVSWTDFFQGVLMFMALIIVPVMTIHDLGGWNETVALAAEVDMGHIDIYSGMSVVSIISLAAWGLGYFGQPHILARFMAIRSSSIVPKARLIGMTWMIFGILGSVFVGFAGIGFFADAPLEDAEKVFLELTQIQFNPWIAGVLLAGILSAIMSTVDSQLLVCSSAIAEDFYKALFKEDAGDRELVWIGRGSVIVIALIAVAIAANPESMVLELVAYAWAGFGASFGPVVLFGLFWRRVTRNAAMAGIVTGAITVIVWKQLSGGLFEVYEILPGFVLGSLTILLVSLLGKEPEVEVQEEFDRIE